MAFSYLFSYKFQQLIGINVFQSMPSILKRLLRNLSVVHLKSHSTGQIITFEKQRFSEFNVFCCA